MGFDDFCVYDSTRLDMFCFVLMVKNAHLLKGLLFCWASLGHGFVGFYLGV